MSVGVAAPVFPGTTVRLSGRRAVRSAAEPTGGLLILAIAASIVKRRCRDSGLGIRDSGSPRSRQRIQLANSTSRLASNGTAEIRLLDPHQVVLARALAQHEHAARDGLLGREAGPLVGHAAVVHVHAAAAARAASRRPSTTPASSRPSRPRSSVPAPANSAAAISVDGTSSNTAMMSSTSSSLMRSPKSSPDACSARSTASCAVDRARHLARQRALRLARLRRARDAGLERLDLAAIEEREELQVLHDVAVVGVQPELVEPERRRAAADRARPRRPRSCRT